MSLEKKGSSSKKDPELADLERLVALRTAMESQPVSKEDVEGFNIIETDVLSSIVSVIDKGSVKAEVFWNYVDYTRYKVWVNEARSSLSKIREAIDCPVSQSHPTDSKCAGKNNSLEDKISNAKISYESLRDILYRLKNMNFSSSLQSPYPALNKSKSDIAQQFSIIFAESNAYFLELCGVVEKANLETIFNTLATFDGSKPEVKNCIKEYIKLKNILEVFGPILKEGAGPVARPTSPLSAEVPLMSVIFDGNKWEDFLQKDKEFKGLQDGIIKEFCEEVDGANYGFDYDCFFDDIKNKEDLLKQREEIQAAKGRLEKLGESFNMLSLIRDLSEWDEYYQQYPRGISILTNILGDLENLDDLMEWQAEALQIIAGLKSAFVGAKDVKSITQAVKRARAGHFAILTHKARLDYMFIPSWRDRVKKTLNDALEAIGDLIVELENKGAQLAVGPVLHKASSDAQKTSSFVVNLETPVQTLPDDKKSASNVYVPSAPPMGELIKAKEAPNPFVGALELPDNKSVSVAGTELEGQPSTTSSQRNVVSDVKQAVPLAFVDVAALARGLAALEAIRFSGKSGMEFAVSDLSGIKDLSKFKLVTGVERHVFDALSAIQCRELASLLEQLPEPGSPVSKEAEQLISQIEGVSQAIENAIQQVKGRLDVIEKASKASSSRKPYKVPFLDEHDRYSSRGSSARPKPEEQSPPAALVSSESKEEANASRLSAPQQPGMFRLPTASSSSQQPQPRTRPVPRLQVDRDRRKEEVVCLDEGDQAAAENPHSSSSSSTTTTSSKLS